MRVPCTTMLRSHWFQFERDNPPVPTPDTNSSGHTWPVRHRSTPHAWRCILCVVARLRFLLLTLMPTRSLHLVFLPPRPTRLGLLFAVPTYVAYHTMGNQQIGRAPCRERAQRPGVALPARRELPHR